MPPDLPRKTMRVLVATDGSNGAKCAVEWLRRMPLPAERDIMVLTVVMPPLIAGVPEAVGDLHGALVAEARRLADDTAAELNSGRAVGRVVEGDPREEIVDAAKSWGADLIVLGARGLGAIKELLLGSVSLGVAAHAPCPVLVCRGEPRNVRAVTVALDGSAQARGALEWFTALPLADDVRIRLLGVVEPQHYPSAAPGILGATLRDAVAAVEAERRTMLEKTCAAAAASVRARVAEPQIAVITGRPAEAIVAHAERDGSDLVVLGARGLGAIKRLLLGSVSESVLRHAACPVLVVRPPAGAPATYP